MIQVSEPMKMAKDVLNFFGFAVFEDKNNTTYGFMQPIDHKTTDSVFMPVGSVSDLLGNVGSRMDSFIEAVAQKTNLVPETIYVKDSVYGIPTWVYNVTWIKLAENDSEPVASATHPNRAVALIYSLSDLASHISGAEKETGMKQPNALFPLI